MAERKKKEIYDKIAERKEERLLQKVERDRELKKVLKAEEPRFIKMARDYENEFVVPTLEERKKTLEQMRSFKVPIQQQGLKEHQRKYM